MNEMNKWLSSVQYVGRSVFNERVFKYRGYTTLIRRENGVILADILGEDWSFPDLKEALCEFTRVIDEWEENYSEDE
ncbi:MAG: hypothetical protein KatS3mg054_0335 [Chloroflexus sp.]|nr:MAG: hypothetical protein KatS3mg054_0335 [Chloroflexus sp.]